MARRFLSGGVIRTHDGGSRIGLQVGGPLLTLVAVVICDILTRRGAGLPVPMVLLLLTVVASAILGGLRPAIISVVLVLLYSLHFFSVPHLPLTYTAAGLRQLVTVFLAAPAVGLSVGAMRQRELDRALADDSSPASAEALERAELPTGSVGTVAMGAARQAANSMAEWCTVNVLDSTGRLQCVAAAHRHAPRDAAARQLMSRPSREADGRVTPAGVWGGPTPALLEVDDRVVAALAASEPERLTYEALAPRRILTVPLRARGRALGVLEFGSAGPNELTPDAIPAAERFADRVAHALDAATTAAASEDTERRYRMLFESHPNPMWIFDAETLGFLDVNESAVRQYGYSRAEFLDMTIMEVLPDNDAAPEPAPEPRNGKRDGVALSRHQKKDGTLIDVEIVSHSLTFAGRPARLVLVTDVSDRARTRVALHEREEQLRRAQKSDAAARLASGVAHDFNNVLTAIRGYSDLLLGEFDASDPRIHDIEEIRRAADRGALLTRQLLAFGQRQPVQAEPVDLNEVVRNLESLLQRLVGADVQLETVLAPAIGRIRADSGQIEQVVMNLVLNARDAMPNGGTLTIETSERQMSAPTRGARAGWYVVLAVTDSGTGMDEETRTRVFEPFFSTKQSAQGSGLGLAIVHGIVKGSGGMIRLSSEPGTGTSVRLFFPRLDDSAAAALAADAGEARGMETVLLVEDEEPVRAVLRKMLSANGYMVLEARHGRDALLVAERHRAPIHLLLTDVVMPEMGGRELAERLTAQRPDLRVLFISGYTSDEVVRKGIGGAGFMQKPFTSADLLRAVRERLDEPAAEAEAAAAEPA